MDNAAGEGHLDVVTWLHRTRREGGTSRGRVSSRQSEHQKETPA
ncbi:hypothetical protein L914_12743, partial [Phytophthora nicotianae]